MNTDLKKKKCKKIILKEIGRFEVMNNGILEKTMENVRKHRHIKVVTTKRRNYLLSKPNYHIAKFFRENLFAKEI